MLSVYVHRDGDTQCVERVEREWLDPSSPVTVWVDLVKPTPQEGQDILADLFAFHPLSIEDALSEIHHPKVESYGSYLYLILHGIDFHEGEHKFATRDVDFFLGRNYLVTVHDGHSRSIANLKAICDRHEHVLAEGPVGVLHRIVDSIVDSYGPEVDRLEEHIETIEEEAILGADQHLMRAILTLKRDLASLRRVVVPQRDAVGRLARREFSQITDEMAYRFRDVFDHLVRTSDEAALFQDRVTGILEGYLSTISNRLNQIMKVLTVMSTIFLPLTVLTGMWGMNVPLPDFPGGDALQFWWVSAIMAVLAAAMLWFFRRRGWI